MASKMVRQFVAKNSPSDARSGNPRMGKYKGKGGYAIPYSDESSRSPYKPGPRGRRSFTPKDPWRYEKPDKARPAGRRQWT
jgi:hypothetical protein